MTLEQRTDHTGTTSNCLVACPFCDTELEVDSPYNYDYRLAGMFVEIPDPFTVGRCNHVIRDTARNAY